MTIEFEGWEKSANWFKSSNNILFAFGISGSSVCIKFAFQRLHLLHQVEGNREIIEWFWKNTGVTIQHLTNNAISQIKLLVTKERKKEVYRDDCLDITCFTASFTKILGSLSNHDEDGNKNPTNLHIWKWKTAFAHALLVLISSFDILMTFSFFLRREMSRFAVVWTTWAYDDKC